MKKFIGERENKYRHNHWFIWNCFTLFFLAALSLKSFGLFKCLLDSYSFFYLLLQNTSLPMYHDPEQYQAYLHTLITSQTLKIDYNLLDTIVQLSTLLLQCATLPEWQSVSNLLDKLAKRLKHDEKPSTLSETLRMTIYHHRALRYESDLFYDQAVIYYTKVLGIHVPAEIGLVSDMQEMAKASLQSLTQARRHMYSSDGSDVEHICVGCGIEAERMPVCARCKRVRMCSLACVRRSEHKKLCKKRVTFA